MALLLALVSFVTVVLILGGLLLLAGGGRRQEVIRRRLASIEKAQKRGSTSLELELVRDELLSDVPVIHQMLLRWAWAGRLRTFIWQAGLRIKPGKLVLVSAVLAMGAGLMAHYMYRNLLLTPVAGVVGGLLPPGFVAFLRRAGQGGGANRQAPAGARGGRVSLPLRGDKFRLALKGCAAQPERVRAPHRRP